MNNKPDFKAFFLDKFLAGGFGSMSKKEIEILVMHLIDQIGKQDSDPLAKLDNYEMGIELKLSPGKVKNLRYEGRLKYGKELEVEARKVFLNSVNQFHYEATGDVITLLIDNIFARNWLQEQIRKQGLVFDNSFSSDLVKLKSGAFKKVFFAVFEANPPTHEFEFEDLIPIAKGLITSKLPDSYDLLNKIEDRLRNVFGGRSS